MVHPLFRSKTGSIIWQELPEYLRLYDNPIPDQNVLGDLEALIHGFGHILDRMDASLAQFLADGFVAPHPTNPDAEIIQNWLVPYFADIFGIELLNPDHNMRREELLRAIWVSKRRGAIVGVEQAAKSILHENIVVVPGAQRVLRKGSISESRFTHFELSGAWHQGDGPLLSLRPDDYPPEISALPRTISEARITHAGLRSGTRHIRRKMRAIRQDRNIVEAHTRLVRADDGALARAEYEVVHQDGVPCFRHSYEDRAPRTLDIRSPAQGMRRYAGQSNPNLTWIHVAPPTGFFHPDMLVVNRRPRISAGVVDVSDFDEDIEDIFFDAPSTNLQVNSGALTTISGLRYNGALRLTGQRHVIVENSAVRHIEIGVNTQVEIRNSVISEIDAPNPSTRLVLDYTTVTGHVLARWLRTSDCILNGLEVEGSDENHSCIRYSRIPRAFAENENIQLIQCTRQPVYFVEHPCLPDVDNPTERVLRSAHFGEAGYGVLADNNPASIRFGAQDGTEPGGYHHQYHLARLDLAPRAARGVAMAGQFFTARYDNRLLAPLPNQGE